MKKNIFTYDKLSKRMCIYKENINNTLDKRYGRIWNLRI